MDRVLTERESKIVSLTSYVKEFLIPIPIDVGTAGDSKDQFSMMRIVCFR